MRSRDEAKRGVEFRQLTQFPPEFDIKWETVLS